MYHHPGPLLGLVSVLLMLGFLAFYGGWRHAKRADLSMTAGLFAWVVYMLWVLRFASSPADEVDEFVEHLSFQICLAAGTGLVLLGANVLGNRLWAMWLLQGAGGSAVLAAWAWTQHELLFDVWQHLNLLVSGGVIAVLLLRFHGLQNSAHARMGLLLSLLLVFSGLAGALQHGESHVMSSIGVYLYPAALFSFWWFVTGRYAGRQTQNARTGPVLASASERELIAQDVHDGVGSQLVSILATLDLRDPRHRELAFALEQCLFDLKLTVDRWQDDLHSLPQALAMLRYRVQPMLDRAGIRLTWQLAHHPAMDNLPRESVVHALRVCQEAVANAMRHAQASTLRFEVRYLEASHSVEASIEDNGQGFVPDRARSVRQGRGLSGMRRRAAVMGGEIDIESRPGHGTSVRLLIPCLDTQAQQNTQSCDRPAPVPRPGETSEPAG